MRREPLCSRVTSSVTRSGAELSSSLASVAATGPGVDCDEHVGRLRRMSNLEVIASIRGIDGDTVSRVLERTIGLSSRQISDL